MADRRAAAPLRCPRSTAVQMVEEKQVITISTIYGSTERFVRVDAIKGDREAADL